MDPIRKKWIRRTKQGQRDLTGIEPDIYLLIRLINGTVSNTDCTTYWQYWLLSYAGVIHKWWLSRHLEWHRSVLGILMALSRHSTGGNKESHKNSSQNNRWKCETRNRSLLKRSHRKIIPTLSRCFRFKYSNQLDAIVSQVYYLTFIYTTKKLSKTKFCITLRW